MDKQLPWQMTKEDFLAIEKIHFEAMHGEHRNIRPWRDTPEIILCGGIGKVIELLFKGIWEHKRGAFYYLGKNGSLRFLSREKDHAR